MAVSDPIKASTLPAIETLRARGVRTVMVTGDDARTAEVVAQQGLVWIRLQLK